MCIGPSRSCLERFGARNDFDEFLGDLRLALAVVLDRQLVDHVAGIARGIVHGAHPRALFGGRVFEQRPEDLHRDVARQEIGEDLALVRLVVIDGAAEIGAACRPRRWPE